MLSASKNMKLIIIWDQVVACRKMKKKKKGGDIASSGGKLSVVAHLSRLLIEQKSRF